MRKIMSNRALIILNKKNHDVIQKEVFESHSNFVV